MADQEQYEILKRGVEEWNQWRQKHLPDIIRPDLIEADLTGANLKGADQHTRYARQMQPSAASLHQLVEFYPDTLALHDYGEGLSRFVKTSVLNMVRIIGRLNHSLLHISVEDVFNTLPVLASMILLAHVLATPAPVKIPAPVKAPIGI